MYKKTISGLSIVAAAFGLAAFSAPASAACTTDTDSVWECLEVETSPASNTYTDRTDMGLQGVGGNKNGTNPFTFEGPATLSHWFTGTLNCTLTANGYAGVDTSNNTATVEVTSLSSSGGGSCGSVTFGGLSLTTTISGANHGDVYNKHGSMHNAHGVLGDNGTLAVYYNGTQVCNDKVELEFGNDVAGVNKDDPSFFRFNDSLSGWAGSCSVSGTLTTDPGNDGVAPVYHDVNAW